MLISRSIIRRFRVLVSVRCSCWRVSCRRIVSGSQHFHSQWITAQLFSPVLIHGAHFQAGSRLEEPFLGLFCSSPDPAPAPGPIGRGRRRWCPGRLAVVRSGKVRELSKRSAHERERFPKIVRAIHGMRGGSLRELQAVSMSRFWFWSSSIGCRGPQERV